MNTLRVSHTARVHAPAAVAYRLIADYRTGHTRIVPPRYFSNIVVEEGGYGAGTRIRYDATLLGTRSRLHAAIEEPQPGRVLVEREVDRGTVTTFNVVPAGDDACEVTISTEMPDTGGLRGLVERFVSRRMLPRIFREELARLDAAARADAKAAKAAK
jgi:Polyketide cyclase / dehydrase and lipid transport